MYPGAGNITTMGTMRGRHGYLVWLVCVQTNSLLSDKAGDEAWSRRLYSEARCSATLNIKPCTQIGKNELNLDYYAVSPNSGARPALEVRALVKKRARCRSPVTPHIFTISSSESDAGEAVQTDRGIKVSTEQWLNNLFNHSYVLYVYSRLNCESRVFIENWKWVSKGCGSYLIHPGKPLAFPSL